jgi:hypothetical protein
MVSQSGRRVYLDASTIIYALEQISQLPNLKTGMLDPLDAGAFTAMTSEIALVETIVGPRKSGDIRTRSGLSGVSYTVAEPDPPTDNRGCS